MDSGPGRSEAAATAPYGRMAPSWAFTPHAFPNGWALLAVVLGALALGLAAGPAGLGLASALPLALAAGGAGAVGRRRWARQPWRGGRRAASIGIALAATAVVVGLVGLVA